MKNLKAIPEGYMTVGQAAKRMNVTVRTLQYYDKEGLLAPSNASEGGRRLYTDKDLVLLHQILSLKYLGFSLEEIKSRLETLDTPQQVAAALEAQAEAIREKLAALAELLQAAEALKAEVLAMQTVDFKKYADIIVNLQLKNDNYWLIKHFDDDTLDFIRARFTKDSGLAFMRKFEAMQSRAASYGAEGTAPDSPEGQAFAKAYWEMLMEFSGGNMELLAKLTDIAEVDSPNEQWKQSMQAAVAFIEPALDVYLTKTLGFDPLGGDKK